MATLLSLLLFSFLLSHSINADSGPRFHKINLRSARLSTTCSSTSATGGDGNGLKVTHRFGPCSPLGRQRRGRSHHLRLLRLDQQRANSIGRLVSNATTTADSVTLPDRLGLPSLEYVVTIGLGTPKRDQTVIFDTGSDLSWVQCQPCAIECYPQTEPLFNPTDSSTFATVPCTAPDCALAGGGADNCIDDACFYFVQYGDNSYTSGTFSTETLTLAPGSIIPGFEFGCGEATHGVFTPAAGLIGLGRGKLSLASQYGGSVFSYCIPTSPSSTGHLTLGGGGGGGGQPMAFTPMIQKTGQLSSFYFLSLVGITVAGLDVPIGPGVLSGGGGTIIDSGTVVTHLQPDAYAALRDEFRGRMSGYPMGPSLGGFLDTCYNLTGTATVRVPAVGLKFDGGATLDVDPSGILYMVSASQACLAFAALPDGGQVGAIIGNMQQRGYDVVYDVGKGVIGFGAGGCS